MSEPLRILYSFPHTVGRPGISTTAYWQIRGLVDLGHDVTLVCTSLARPIDGLRNVIETMSVAGRRVPHRAIGVERAYALHDTRAARVLRRPGGRVDLVHAWPAACLRTLTVARGLGIPSFREVPSPHTRTAWECARLAADEAGVTLPPGHHHHWDADRLAREEAEFCAAGALLVPSDYVAGTFRAHGFPQSRLVRHRYGFDPGAFPVPPPRTSDGGLVVAFVGRGEPSKGLHVALQAWGASSARANGGRLLVCGRIMPAYRERIARLLDGSSVEELGFIEDVGDVLRRADVLALPSFSEGSALVTFEAMASGCVPVVSDAAGAPCVHLDDGVVHRVGDAAALARWFDSLDVNRALLHRLRQRALAHRGELTWSAAAGALEAAYRSVLAVPATVAA